MEDGNNKVISARVKAEESIDEVGAKENEKSIYQVNELKKNKSVESSEMVKK
jgi:hypothetical protein